MSEPHDLTRWLEALQAGDSAALADAIAGLLNQPQRCTELGRKLRARAAHHFSWDRAGRHLLNIYRTVLESKARDRRANPV